MNLFRKVCLSLGVGNRNVFGTILISTLFVVFFRSINNLDIYWDLSIQLESAYRLVQGHGLTNAFSSGFDLNQPPISAYLTHFPPGLSILVAALLAGNIPLAIILKVVYGLISIFGWICWAIIASRCLLGKLNFTKRFLPLHLVIASILPILHTPYWGGTDIFLWAGVPVFTLLILRSCSTSQWLITTILSGLVLGILLLFRYASGFLLIAAPLIIFQNNFPKLKLGVIQLVVFLLSFLASISPLAVYLKLVSKSGFNEISSNDLLQTH
ncbi:MAG: hypothetical protein AAF704_06645, partial [Cyanobacteria bacterium P01_D01_bin.123]